MKPRGTVPNAAPGKKPPREKPRLDHVLVERGLADSGTQARALILAGKVFAGTRRLDKPGMLVPPGTAIEVRGPAHPFVSRGGVKLARALDAFDIDPTGLTCLDVGASTGGFTDALLQRGAVRVYAVDVGHGQLHWKLRNDPRVVVRERCNARHLSATEVPELVDLIVVDASFIGLTTVLPAPLARLKPGGRLVALIKPQFEVGPALVGKGGVVRDPALHDEVCGRIRHYLEAELGLAILGLVESPILGPEGNKEFLIGAQLHPRG